MRFTLLIFFSRAGPSLILNFCRKDNKRETIVTSYEYYIQRITLKCCMDLGTDELCYLVSVVLI